MPAIDRAGAAVIARVKWIGDVVVRILLPRRTQVAALNVDLMPIGVRQLQSQPMPVLHAQSRLEGVEVVVGRILHLRDARIPGKGSEQVCVRSGGHTVPVRHVAERQGVDCSLNVLMPAAHADVLDLQYGGWRQLLLYSQAVLLCSRVRIGVLQASEGSREEWSRSSLP